MTIAGLCGLIIFVLLAVMLIAGVPIDRCPENFLRYLRIQPSCHSFLYPGRKPDE